MTIKRNYKYIPYYLATYTFLISIIFMPLYQSGDQTLYRTFHEIMIENSELAKSYYIEKIGASDMGYYYLIKILYFVNKDWLIILANTVIGILFGLILRDYNVSKLTVLFLSTNYYYFVLLFSLERLKFSIIFILISILIQKLYLRYILQGIALFIHTQSIFLIYLIDSYMLLNVGIKEIFYYIRYNLLYVLFLSACIIFLFIFFIDLEKIVSKINFYYSQPIDDLSGIKSIILFSIIFYLGGIENIKVPFLTFPIFLVTFFLGGERINIILFSIIIYLSIINNKSNKIFFTICSYYSISGLAFLINIIKYGNGDNSNIFKLFIRLLE